MRNKRISEEEKVKQVATSLRKLIKVLKDIENHPTWPGVFATAHMHGYIYMGPNWKDALCNSEELLEELNLK